MIEWFCSFLFAFGHLVRDGEPATGSTHLARFLGGLLCFLGSALVLPWLPAAALGVSFWLGFYLDQKHGEGQGATTWTDAAYLSLSGVTSIALPAITLAYFFGLPFLAVALLGLTKVPIWFLWWAVEGHNGERRLTSIIDGLYPTRCAAFTFGMVGGATVALVSQWQA